MSAIVAENLTRHFGKFVAVNQVNFSIEYGEIFGFLGSNGAGKSTTIRMLCGILAATSGTARVAGYDINTQSEDIKHSIGYVSQKFSLYGDLTVEENLRFYSSIYGIPRVEHSKRISEILQQTNLQSYQHRLASELSGGWRQKLALANAIVHRPKILFLDEPTSGIDPISRRSIWELLYQIAHQGVALFVTTHYMEEAERCNQIAFISRGRLLRQGSPEELKLGVAGQLLEVSCRPVMKASQLFSKISGVRGLTAYGTSIHLHAEDSDSLRREIMNLANSHGIEIQK